MKFAVFTLFLLCAACDRPDFAKYGELKGLRILTIKASADQGEVDLGSTVTLEPVVSDLAGGGRNLNVTVTACLDPGISLGAAPVCTVPDSTQTSSFSTTTLSGNGTFTGAAPTFSVTVPPANPIFSALPLYLRYNGYAYLVIYTLTAPNGESTTAFKRIVMSDVSKTVKNKNPAIANVAANGGALAGVQAYGSSSMDLTIGFGLGGENYSVMKPDGSLQSRDESILTTWYFTDGEMKYQRTSGSDSNHWDASKPTGRAAALVVVTTDGRGGEDFKIFEFN